MDKLATMLQKAIPQTAQTCGNSSRTTNPNPSPTTTKCTECGRPLNYIQIPILARMVLPACPCREAAYLREEKERHRQEKKDYLRRLFARSGLGERYRHCSFDNFESTPGSAAAFGAARRYASDIADNIKKGRGLLLSGSVGTGKSHLIAAIVNTAVNGGFSTIVERVPKLLLTIKDSYNGGAYSEMQLIRGLTGADLLVLDDAGSEKWTEWTEPTLYTIIDERYNHERALLITTNLKLEGLQQKIGTRAMDRLVEMCDIMETSGPSYRRERAKKHLARQRTVK